MSNIDYNRALPSIQAGLSGLDQLGGSSEPAVPPFIPGGTPSTAQGSGLNMGVMSGGLPMQSPRDAALAARSGAGRTMTAQQQAVSNFASASVKELQRLKERADLFSIQNKITEQVRYQEQMEADLVLSPLLGDLAKFAGSHNWAGLYAKRKEIVENPLFFKSREVAAQMSRLDQNLDRIGTEVTTDGRKVTFNDVTRMVGSGDPEMQKEGLRILALRSENALQFLDNIPLSGEAAKDPLFRFHLRTFVKENPRIDPTDYEMYDKAKQFYFEGIRQQYKNDPKMAVTMMSSPQTQEELRNLRESLLRNKNTRESEWAPPAGNSDSKISAADLNFLSDLVSDQIFRSGATTWMKMKRGLTGESARTAGRLRAEMDQPGARLLRQQAQTGGAVPGSISADGTPLTDENRVGFTGASTAALGGIAGAGATSLVTRGLKAPTVGGLVAAGLSYAGDVFLESAKAKEVIQEEQLKAKLNFMALNEYRDAIRAEVSKPVIDEKRMGSFYNKLTSSIEELNNQMQSMGLEYQLSPLNLFTKREFQIISSKAARQQAAQAARLMGAVNPTMGLSPVRSAGMMPGAGGNPLLNLGAVPVPPSPAE